VFGLPFFSVANISLYSKITDEKTQGEWISLDSKIDESQLAASVVIDEECCLMMAGIICQQVISIKEKHFSSLFFFFCNFPTRGI